MKNDTYESISTNDDAGGDGNDDTLGALGVGQPVFHGFHLDLMRFSKQPHEENTNISPFHRLGKRVQYFAQV